jgi:hypothetical protein
MRSLVFNLLIIIAVVAAFGAGCASKKSSESSVHTREVAAAVKPTAHVTEPAGASAKYQIEVVIPVAPDFEQGGSQSAPRFVSFKGLIADRGYALLTNTEHPGGMLAVQALDDNLATLVSVYYPDVDESPAAGGLPFVFARKADASGDYQLKWNSQVPMSTVMAASVDTEMDFRHIGVDEAIRRLQGTDVTSAVVLGDERDEQINQ